MPGASPLSEDGTKEVKEYEEQPETAKSSVVDLSNTANPATEDMSKGKENESPGQVEPTKHIEELETSWKTIATLRSHFNAVRSVQFHPSHNNALFSASEDHTAKLWNLGSLKNSYATSFLTLAWMFLQLQLSEVMRSL
jgi:WD40 repeat protein